MSRHNKYIVKYTVLQYMTGNADRIITLQELYDLMPHTSHSVISTTCGVLVRRYPKYMERVDHGVYRWNTVEGREARVVTRSGGADIIIRHVDTGKTLYTLASSDGNDDETSDADASVSSPEPIAAVAAAAPETPSVTAPVPASEPLGSELASGQVLMISIVDVDGKDMLVRDTDDGAFYIMTPLNWKKAR